MGSRGAAPPCSRDGTWERYDTGVTLGGSWGPPDRRDTEASSLLEISQALSGILNLKSALHRVLEILEQHHGMVRSIVTFLGDDTRQLYIEASDGLPLRGQRAQYRLGEGITGRVVQSGKPIVVPQVSREPLFLNRAGQREKAEEELTFICVPILLNRKTVGSWCGPAL